jgi:hypothetical protein
MNELDCSISHANTGGIGQSRKRQLQVDCHLDGNYRDTCSGVQAGKLRIFGEMGNVVFRPEDRVVRCDLLVAENLLNRFVKSSLSAFVLTLTLKMRREIATTSTEASPTTPFTFGSRLEIRKWIDRLCR